MSTGDRTATFIELDGDRHVVADFKSNQWVTHWAMTDGHRQVTARTWENGWWDYRRSCLRRVEHFKWMSAFFNMFDDDTGDPLMRASFVQLELTRVGAAKRERAVRFEFGPGADELDRSLALAVAWSLLPHASGD